MALIFDLGVIAIVVLFAMSGYKKGLLVSVVNVVGTVVAAAVAPILGSVFSTIVYTNFIKGAIINSVANATKDIPINATSLQKANELLDSIPNSVFNMLSLGEGDRGVREMSEAISSASNLDLPNLVEGMVSAKALGLISTILTVIFFIIISVALKFAAHILTKTVEVVKLGGVNKFFGGMFGVAESVLVIMVITCLVYFVTMFMSPESCANVNDRINETLLYKYIYQYSMPDAIIGYFMPK